MECLFHIWPRIWSCFIVVMLPFFFPVLFLSTEYDLLLDFNMTDTTSVISGAISAILWCIGCCPRIVLPYVLPSLQVSGECFTTFLCFLKLFYLENYNVSFYLRFLINSVVSYLQHDILTKQFYNILFLISWLD